MKQVNLDIIRSSMTAMNQLIVLLVVGYLAIVASSKASLNEWNEYKKQYGKEYTDQEEENMRMSIFLKNKKMVEEFNSKQSATAGYTIGINHLSDRTESEISRLHGVRLPENFDYSMTNSPQAQNFLDDILNDNSKQVPDAVDWRDVPNRVTPVKDQGDCGSCWAYSATGVLEGQEINRNVSTLITLSDQNLIDCDKNAKGCHGGWPYEALKFVSTQGGIDDAKSYSQSGSHDQCAFSKDNVVMTDTGAAHLPKGDEEKMKEVVAKYGPVSICIDTNAPGFAFYKGGIYKSDICSSNPKYVNHAVLIVGYGSDPKGGDYWILKNSWNTSWGYEGYMLMARNSNNMCGLANFGVIATF